MKKPSKWLPPRPDNPENVPRHVGVEIELAGMEPMSMVRCIQDLYGGQLCEQQRFIYQITDTELGNFLLELDAAQLKSLGKKIEQSDMDFPDDSVQSASVDLLTKTAELIVPWEIVTAPIPVTQLFRLPPLIESLREHGALGTRHALQYAFGVHLNPELPALDVSTILAYLRAFLCLYDWIVTREKIDLVRRILTYIDHFDVAYISKIVDVDYQPDMNTLIEDYIDANPTRNRSLDMLPLFAHLDKQRVFSRLDDERIKARPTLHYRLPNCDIDNPEWNLDKTWSIWLQVEHLAADDKKLRDMCRHYYRTLQDSRPNIDHHWAQESEKWLSN